METDELLADVRRVGDLDSTEEAETAARAVLSVFAERITEGEAGDLAEQFPEPFADPLTSAEKGEAESFPVEAFRERVADAAGVDGETARRYARAVFTAVGDAAPEEFARAREQLPDEYDRLLEAGTPMDAEEFRAVVEGQLEESEAEADPDPDAVTEATLETLGERLARGEAADLATYLPSEYRDPLVESAEEDPPAFPTAEFVTRVANRTGLKEKDARAGTEAVLAVVADAAGDRELAAARSQLPAGYDDLFEHAEA